MTKKEAMERFSSGNVQQSIEIHRWVQWIGRTLGVLGGCVLLVRYMPSEWLRVCGTIYCCFAYCGGSMD
nr:hypothetical protein [Veillonella denticariosi]